MSDEQINKLEVAVALLEQRVVDMKEHDAKIKNKLDALLGQVIKSNSDREADMFVLKVALKKKISESVNSLKEYHDKDVEALTWAKFLGNNKKFLVIIALLILFAAGDRATDLIKGYVKNYNIELNEIKPSENEM